MLRTTLCFSLLRYFDQLRPESFKAVMGMSKETFLKLEEEIGEFIPCGSSRNGKSLVPRERLMIFLWKMRGNTFIRHDEVTWNTSYGVIAQSVDKVLEAFFKDTREKKNFVERNIYLPNEEEAYAEAVEFNRRNKFPKIAYASVDGNYLPILVHFTQYGNLMIFLSLRFYVKSTLGILEVHI